jgi:hypothetical protein
MNLQRIFRAIIRLPVITGFGEVTAINDITGTGCQQQYCRECNKISENSVIHLIGLRFMLASPKKSILTVYAASLDVSELK